MNILDCVGKTPLLFLDRVSRLVGANIYAKLENANPGHSAKDRAALAYLRGAMRRGELAPCGCVVEAASGNLGLALAQACLKLDLRLLLCLPESVGRARLSLLQAMGVHLFVTPAEDGIRGAMAKAAYHHDDTWGSFRPNPYSNPDGPDAYDEGLGAEIVLDAQSMGIKPDAFVCSIGSGATFSGAGRRLRRVYPDIFLGAVISPACSVLEDSLPEEDSQKNPVSVFDRALVSQQFSVDVAEAERAARKLLGMEGIVCGLSSGANLHAVLQLAAQPEFRGKTIVMVVHDSGV